MKNHTFLWTWALIALLFSFIAFSHLPASAQSQQHRISFGLDFEGNKLYADAALPNNAAGKYDKNVVGGVVGVGFEMYLSDNLVFNGKGLLHLTGSEWLDDYQNSSNDKFLTFGVGFSYYIFGELDQDHDGLT